jgi:hypothetical protein
MFDRLIKSSGPLALCVTCLACAPSHEEDLGALNLRLTSEDRGITYRLADARFTLEGPNRREFAAGDEQELTLELPSGAYRLTLLEGYKLIRADMPDAGPVAASLVSQNPAPVLVSAGATARVALRFELAEGAASEGGSGRLSVGIEVGPRDAGASDDCVRGLRINELDYEQASSDDAEFIEIVNTDSCPASLTDVSLELVNGSDGENYGRYPLTEAGALGAGERLVIGDPNVLAALPAQVKRVMLNGSGMQNGPDAVRLVRGMQVLDLVAYEGAVAGAADAGVTAADDGALALARCPDGFDTEGTLDFALVTPTPGSANACEMR